MGKNDITTPLPLIPSAQVELSGLGKRPVRRAEDRPAVKEIDMTDHGAERIQRAKRMIESTIMKAESGGKRRSVLPGFTDSSVDLFTGKSFRELIASTLTQQVPYVLARVRVVGEKKDPVTYVDGKALFSVAMYHPKPMSTNIEIIDKTTERVFRDPAFFYCIDDSKTFVEIGGLSAVMNKSLGTPMIYLVAGAGQDVLEQAESKIALAALFEAGRGVKKNIEYAKRLVLDLDDTLRKAALNEALSGACIMTDSWYTKHLLVQGANPNAPEEASKITPLALATSHRARDNIMILLEHGADPYQDSSIGSAYAVAEKSNNMELCHIFEKKR